MLDLKGKYTVMFVEDIHLLDTASMQVLIKLAEEFKTYYACYYC